MKTRIKKEISGFDLSVTYTPQYKSRIWIWLNFFEMEYVWDYEMHFPMYFKTLERAKEFIDEKRAEKCNSTSYIYY